MASSNIPFLNLLQNKKFFVYKAKDFDNMPPNSFNAVMPLYIKSLTDDFILVHIMIRNGQIVQLASSPLGADLSGFVYPLDDRKLIKKLKKLQALLILKGTRHFIYSVRRDKLKVDWAKHI